MKFVKSVDERDDAVLFGILGGKQERSSIKQFYYNVDTVSDEKEFKARINVVSV